MTTDYQSILEKVQNQDLMVIDSRINHDFLGAHIPGSVNVPYNSYGWGRSIKSWLNGQEIELAVVADSDEMAGRAADELKAAGLNVVEIFADSLSEWKNRNMPLSSVSEISPDDLYSHIDRWTVIDVREPYEWQSGTIKNSLKIPMNDLPGKLTEFNSSDKYAVVCAHGNRSEVAALFLADNGLQAATLVGGMYAWLSQQLPVEYED